MLLLSFRLYDSTGNLAASTDGFKQFPKGLSVSCEAGEQLLDVPRDLSKPFQYRLYNSEGRLLTWSDGVRTKIYPHLRMEGVARGWVPVAS
ncbi:MAG: hypothetical protein WD939_09940 [Dehalococcoidia bacterium]